MEQREYYNHYDFELKVECSDTEVGPLKNSKIDVDDHLTTDGEAATSPTFEVPLYENIPPRMPTPPAKTKRETGEASEWRHLLEEPSCSTVGANGPNSARPPESPHSLSSETSDDDIDDRVEDYKESYLNQQPTWYRYINEYGMMQCKFCDLTYKVLSTLQFHVSKKHPKEAISLKKARAKLKRNPRIYCRLCLMNFDTVDMLKNHFAKHQKKFTCDYCEADFPSKHEIINHTKDSHMDSEGNFFKTKRKIGVRKRTDKDKFQCPYCEYLSKRNYTLNRHIKARHTTEEDLKFNCPHCKYRAPLRYYLESHIVAKHPDTKFAKSKPKQTCDICGYSTAKKSHYILHRKQHFPEKKHKCEYCDYETNYLACLNDHKRIHTKEKPFRCKFEGCDYRCAAKTGIRCHMVKHYPDSGPKWCCDLCSHTTLYKCSLVKHIKTHSRNAGRNGSRGKKK